MADKAGSIEYEVEVGTSKVLQADKIVNKSLSSIEKKFTNTEKVVDKTTKSINDDLKKTGAETKKTEKTINQSTNKIEGSFKGAEQTIDKTTSAINSDLKETGTRISKTASGVKAGMSGMGRGAGQAGIQIQQFVGQIQGGQNALLAFSQQSADLGFVLGAPLVGAVVGIAATLVSFLIPSLSDSNKNVKELSESLEPLIEGFAKLSNSQKVIAKTGLSEQLKKQQREALKLQNTINELETALIEAERSSGGRFFDRLLGSDPVKAREELSKAKASLTALNLERKETLEQLKKLSTEEANLTEEEVKLKESTEGLLKSLNAQIVALEDGEEAAFRFATAQQLGLKVGEKIPGIIDEHISALFRLKKAQQATKEEEAETKTLKGKVLFLGVDEDEKLTAKFERENELLREAREKDILTEFEFLQRKENLEAEHEENLKKIRDKGNNDAIVNFQALENQAIGTFASIVSGAQSGKDAIKSLAQSILTQMIGALIKMAIQSIVSQGTVTAASVASSASIATAAAPAAALVSLATVGSNSAPAAAGIAAVVGLAAASGREHGGNVKGGSLYQVGEKGKPEIFTSGGKNFMIPGDSGRVSSNKDSFGEQQVQMNVTIENNVSNANVQTRLSEDGKNLKVMINEITNQINSNQGPIPRAFRNSTDLNFRSNR